MQLVILFDHRFCRPPGEAIYSPTSYNYDFFRRRYLEVFDSVRIVARVEDAPAGSCHAPTEGPGVEVVDAGAWKGAWGYFKARRLIARQCERFAQGSSAFMMIVPGGLPTVAFPYLRRTGYPFSLEVVGDPWDAFSPGTNRDPLRPALRRLASAGLKRQCQTAAAALYVTKQFLQSRYPCPGLTAGISDVVLPPEALAATARQFASQPLTIVCVGSFVQLYKGQDLLIDAVRTCVQRGLDVCLVLAGDGRHRGAMERRAESAGISNRVRFTGQLNPASAVRAQLDSADLFVSASRADGLPRALVEAMARALPCIGTRVGGIPELLPPEDLVEPGDAGALARKILEVASDRVRMAEMSLRNRKRAAGYEEGMLAAGRTAFYRQVKEITAQRLASRERGRAVRLRETGATPHWSDL